MAVPCDKAVAVIDLHAVAQAAVPSGVDDGSAVGGVDRRAVGVGDIDGLMIAAGATDAGVAPAEVGGDDAVAGPAEGPCGEPRGPLLGASCLPLGHRLLQRHGGHHLTGRLRAVDDGDVGGDVCLTVHALAEDLVVALIHIRVVHIFHAVRHILQIALPLHVHHRQIRHGTGDGQHIAGMENADVIAGVQGQQFLIGHAVVLGNEGPHIAALNGIGHLTRLGGVELLGYIAQIHNKGLIHVLLLHLHVFHEVAVHGAVGDVALFQLLQQLLDGAGEGGGRHRLPLHIQHIGIIHQPQLLGEVLLQCVGALQLLPGHDAGADLQLGAVDAVIGVGQRLPGDLLQLIHCRRDAVSAANRPQLHAVIAGGGADGIHGQAHRHGRHRHGAGHKHRRVQLHVLEEGPHPSAGANGPLAAAGEPLPEVGAHTGQTAPEE